MSPQNNHLQRPPAAVLYAVELAKLKQNDNAPCPPGWQLSLPAARAFILGDEAQNIRRKVVISPSAVERMLVTLATGRGLMFVLIHLKYEKNREDIGLFGIWRD